MFVFFWGMRDDQHFSVTKNHHPVGRVVGATFSGGIQLGDENGVLKLRLTRDDPHHEPWFFPAHPENQRGKKSHKFINPQNTVCDMGRRKNIRATL